MVEVDHTARSFFPFGGVFRLFCWRLWAPDNSEWRWPGGLMDGAGRLVVWARADPAWFVAARARPRCGSAQLDEPGWLSPPH